MINTFLNLEHGETSQFILVVFDLKLDQFPYLCAKLCV